MEDNQKKAVDFKGKSLDQLQEEGHIDLQIPISKDNIGGDHKTSSIIGSLPVAAKIAIAGIALLVLFGIINVPIWVYHFATN